MVVVLLQDLRFGLRILRRSPGFTVAAVLTLALGIGAATAGFSVVNAVILRPLRFPESARAMTVLSASADSNNKPYKPMEYMYLEWRDRAECFDLFAGALFSRTILAGSGDARDATIAQVSSNFFALIGVRPALGRLFSGEEDRDGRDSVALLDAGFWHREFGGDPNVLGKTVILKERAFTVIGILPAELRFAGFGAADVWIPLAARPSTGGAGRGDILAIGRLRQGATRESAQAEMDAITKQIALERSQYRPSAAVVMPLHDWLISEARRTFVMVLGAAAFLLLIACANIANLMLVRGTGRSREMAIRASLGAGRKRLAAQMLTESVLLAAIGGVVGMALAFAAVRAVPAITAFEIPRVEEIVVDRAFLLVAFTASMASGVLCGLAPALQAWRRDLIGGLHRSEALPGRLSGQRLREALVVAQLALSMVLLSGAGLMTNTLFRLLNVDLGFARSNVFKVRPSLPSKKYDRPRSAQFLRQVAEQVRGIPGIEAVSVATQAPLTEVYGDYRLSYEGAGEHRRCSALGRDVDPGYFRTLAIPLLAGRDFEPADAARKPVPVVLNMAAARRLFGIEDPLGKLVNSGDRRVGMMQVIGVVGDVRLLGVTKQPGPQAFAPLLGGWGSAAQVIARAAPKSSAIAPAIRAVVRSLDPDLPPPEITTLDDVFSKQVAKPRFYMTLFNSSAALGLILASVGIYGVIAFAVARRTHEFGIRLALGAAPGDNARLVLGAGSRVVAAGAVIGLTGALVATRLLSSLLFEVKPWDPLTLAITAVLLVGVALMACWVAARRATGVDVSVALRCE